MEASRPWGELVRGQVDQGANRPGRGRVVQGDDRMVLLKGVNKIECEPVNVERIKCIKCEYMVRMCI